MANNDEIPPRGFPYITAIVTLITLFAFLGLSLWMYRWPNYLGETQTETKPDPAAKLEEIRAKNQDVLEGKPETGAKMSVSEATDKLLGKLKSEKDRLPFPTPEPPVQTVPETKSKN